MPRIVIDVKNDSKLGKGSVLICDGNSWHSTTIGEICSAVTAKYEAIIKEYSMKIDKMAVENAEFRKRYSEDMAKLIPVIEEILKDKK